MDETRTRDAAARTRGAANGQNPHPECREWTKPAPGVLGAARNRSASCRSRPRTRVPAPPYSSISSVTGQWSDPKMSLRIPASRTWSATALLTRK